MENSQNDQVRQHVRIRYAEVAKTSGSSCSSGCCSPASPGGASFSSRLGYTEDELARVPEGSNMGLGCGNPQAIAALKPGEVVLDLGSGGGFDCFLAARQVGEDGRVIGVDMTPEMVEKARSNARRSEMRNVEFRLGEIEHLPVADTSVDVILSNCVINLSPVKDQVFREAYRVLRPGGRLVVSDVVAITPLPEHIKQNLEAHSGCLAGAATGAETEVLMKEAGFTEVSVVIQEGSETFIRDWFPGSGVEAYVRSAMITAYK